MDMYDYEKDAISRSNKTVDDSVLRKKRSQRYQDRFNYYNAVVATLALIISIIALLK